MKRAWSKLSHRGTQFHLQIERIDWLVLENGRLNWTFDGGSRLMIGTLPLDAELLYNAATEADA